MADGTFSPARYRRAADLPMDGEPGSIKITAWVEIEQTVLGYVLMAYEEGHPERLDQVQAKGGASLFFDPCHLEIWKAAHTRHKEGHHVSPVTLANIPALVEALEPLGGKAYLGRVAGVAIFSARFGDYLAALAENRDKRILAAGLERARAELEDGHETAAAVATKLEAQLGNVALSGDLAVKPVSMLAAITSMMKTTIATYHGEEVPGVPTHIPSLDRILNPMGAGQLVLLGGRPSMGKTAKAVSIAVRAARAGTPVIFVSLEMMPDDIVARAVSEETAGKPGIPAVPYSLAKRAYDMTPEQMQSWMDAAQRIEALPLSFLGRRYADPAGIQMAVKQVLKGWGGWAEGRMPLIVVDYLQLLRIPGIRPGDRYAQITEASIACKDLAMRLECPVLALCQLSREVEKRDDKHPVLADLKESGQLEQDADVVLFSYREEYYHDRAEPDPKNLEDWTLWKGIKDKIHNRAEIIVAKQRGGSLGTARIRMNPALNLLWEDREVML